MYIVTPNGKKINECGDGTPHPMFTFESGNAALEKAHWLNETYGNHWDVLRVQMIWTSNDTDRGAGA